jgi:hypothetical protein
VPPEASEPPLLPVCAPLLLASLQPAMDMPNTAAQKKCCGGGWVIMCMFLTLG